MIFSSNSVDNAKLYGEEGDDRILAIMARMPCFMAALN